MFLEYPKRNEYGIFDNELTKNEKICVIAYLLIRRSKRVHRIVANQGRVNFSILKRYEELISNDCNPIEFPVVSRIRKKNKFSYIRGQLDCFPSGVELTHDFYDRMTLCITRMDIGRLKIDLNEIHFVNKELLEDAMVKQKMASLKK